MSNTTTRAPNGASYTDRARLHSEVDPTTGCWVWKGHVSVSGAPMVGKARDDDAPGGPTVLLQPRVVAERDGVAGGRGTWVVTTCGTRGCVNPEHLRPLSPDEVKEHRRTAAGAKFGLERLDDAWNRRLAGESVTSIAEELGISRQGLYRQWSKWGYKPRRA